MLQYSIKYMQYNIPSKIERFPIKESEEFSQELSMDIFFVVS